MTTVTVYNSDVEQALRTLRRMTQRARIFARHRERRFFVDNAMKRRKKLKESYRRYARRCRMRKMNLDM